MFYLQVQRYKKIMVYNRLRAFRQGNRIKIIYKPFLSVFLNSNNSYYTDYMRFWIASCLAMTIHVTRHCEARSNQGY